MLRLIILLFVSCQLFFSPAHVFAGEKIKVTGIYSDMTFNEEGGDVLGDEIFIGYSKEGYFVVFQTSEGEPIMPVITLAEIKDNQIVFTLPEPLGNYGQFVGKISRDKLFGKFKNSGKILNLKRKKSYWQ